MYDIDADNWSILAEAGVEMESSINKGTIRLRRLSFKTALKIGHALAVSLDIASGGRTYNGDSFSLIRATEEAERQITNRNRRIFEARPAMANYAVRIDGQTDQGFSLIADVRNKYEVKPDLGGRARLQEVYITTIESLDLSA